MLNYTTFYSNKSLHKQLASSIKNVLSKTHTLHPYIAQKRIYGLEGKAIINLESLKNNLKNNKIEKNCCNSSI